MESTDVFSVSCGLIFKYVWIIRRNTDVSEESKFDCNLAEMSVKS